MVGVDPNAANDGVSDGFETKYVGVGSGGAARIKLVVVLHDGCATPLSREKMLMVWISLDFPGSTFQRLSNAFLLFLKMSQIPSQAACAMT